MSFLEATPGFEPGIKALQASALPLGHVAMLLGALAPDVNKVGQTGLFGTLRADLRWFNGAGDGIRTHDNHVGNVELYH